MPRVTIDTNDVKTFEATQPGPYTMTFDEVGAEVQTSKEKGTQYLVAWLKFTDPALDKKCGRIRYNLILNGPGAGFTRDAWKAATGETIPLEAKIDIDTDMLVGRTVTVDVGNKEYKGQLQNEANRIVAVA